MIRNADHRPDQEDPAVVGNERLTGQAGAVLLALALAVTVTAAYARALLPIHVFVGVMFLGPLAVMVGSIGYKFLRYLMKSPPFLRRGAPQPALARLAPLLLIANLLVVGTGLALLVSRGFLVLHVFTALAWLPLTAIHAAAHARRLPSLVADDWTPTPGPVPPGRARRLGVVVGALIIGTVAAIGVQAAAAPFFDWSKTIAFGPGPFIVGLVVTGAALLVARPLRWT